MRRDKKRMLIAIIPAVITLLALVIFLTRVVHYTPEHEIHTLQDGFTATCGTAVYEDVALADLPDLIGRDLEEDEVLRLEHRLDLKDLPGPTLALNVRHLAIEILLDNVLIGEIAMDRYYEDHYVGGNQYYIELPDHFTGKTLELICHAAEPGLSPTIEPPVIGDWHDLFHTTFIRNGYVISIGFFLILFGGFFLIYSLIFSVLLPEIRGQRISSVLSVIMGVWLLTHYRATALFTEGTHTMDVEYVTFFLILPLLYLLIWQIQPTGKVFRALALATTGFVAVSFLLHFTDFYHIHHMRNVLYFPSVIFLVAILVIDVRAIRRRRAGVIDLLQLAGPTVFSVILFFGMLLFFVRGGDSVVGEGFSSVVLTTGPLLFAVTRFLIYIWMIVEMGPRRMEYSSLNDLAHRDALTGLANRTRMYELFADLDHSRGDYCMISLDLNDLKYVNDSFGHSAGDALLRSFASVLDETFRDRAATMRIGGDEFLVICEETEKQRIQDDLDALVMRFDARSAASPDIPHSVAAGFAFRSERPSADARGIYLLADQRMYENKRAAKEAAEESE